MKNSGVVAARPRFVSTRKRNNVSVVKIDLSSVLYVECPHCYRRYKHLEDVSECGGVVCREDGKDVYYCRCGRVLLKRW